MFFRFPDKIKRLARLSCVDFSEDIVNAVSTTAFIDDSAPVEIQDDVRLFHPSIFGAAHIYALEVKATRKA